MSGSSDNIPELLRSDPRAELKEAKYDSSLSVVLLCILDYLPIINNELKSDEKAEMMRQWVDRVEYLPELLTVIEEALTMEGASQSTQVKVSLIRGFVLILRYIYVHVKQKWIQNEDKRAISALEYFNCSLGYKIPTRPEIQHCLEKLRFYRLPENHQRDMITDCHKITYLASLARQEQGQEQEQYKANRR